MALVSKKIKGKEVVFLIGRGRYCRCSDCEVLYGGKCPFDSAKFRREFEKKYPVKSTIKQSQEK